MLLYDSLKECPVSVIIDDLLAVLVYWNAVRVDRSRERLCCDGWILLSALGGGGFLVVGCRGLRFLLRALLLWGFAYCRSLPVASLCAQGLEPLL